ncbi:Glutathione S-transferase, N-terminal, partial [Dillenia turbinata]
MASQTVKLLGFWVSPFVYRVIWALKFKGVDYEYIDEDIYNKSALLLELNPVHKKVPVLIHEDRAIAESFVLLEYIDETWKENPLLPNDPYDRAMARFWARFCEEKVLNNSFMALCLEEEEDREKFVKLTIESLEKIEEELKKKKSKFLAGETIGYLDIAMGWIPYWLQIWEEVGNIKFLDPLKFPAITAWNNNMHSHPLIRENLPPRDKSVLDNSYLALCSEEEEDREKFVKLTIESLEKIEEELERKKSKFLAGETIGYLDIAMGWIPYWLQIWEEVGSIKILDPLKFPAITAWINSMLSHPLIKENLPPRDKSVVYFQKRRIEVPKILKSKKILISQLKTLRHQLQYESTGSGL